MSSAAARDSSSISKCAACGKAGDNLKACTACHLVKYCNRDCQKLHWPKHKKECKQRAAELAGGNNKSADCNYNEISEGISNVSVLGGVSASTTATDKKTNTSYEQSCISNEQLFADPPPKEECPICMLPFPHTTICGIETTYMPCCGKMLCCGCVSAAQVEIDKGNMKQWCAFCRVPYPTSNEEALKRLKKRMRMFISYWANGIIWYTKGYEQGIGIMASGSRTGLHSCTLQYCSSIYDWSRC